MVALEAVCDSLPNYKQQLQRGLDLGLIEMSPEPREEDRVYRVPRILPHIIPTIRLPEEPKVYSLYRKAHDKLYKLWGNKENKSEEKWRQVFRLLFADKVNPLRFRQGFSQMLSVQYNSEADRTFESELRQLKDELSEENFCYQLEDYLRQGDWRKADEETAWIFYLVMVQQGYKDGCELCLTFPSETLNKIDQLWVKNSKGQFGFSIQKHIWNNCQQYQIFEKIVGWVVNDDEWMEYHSIPFSGKGQLPALLYTRRRVGGWEVGCWVENKWWEPRAADLILASRLIKPIRK